MNKMKSCIALFFVLGLFSSMQAQNSQESLASTIVSSKGESYLPETGDFSISVDAAPFLKYFGNFIGGNGLNVVPTFDPLVVTQAITGKYFISPNQAYRAGIKFGTSTTKANAGVQAVPNTTPATYVYNVTTTSSSSIGLNAGMEWRKGKTRLQGFYGGEAAFSLLGSGSSFKNGNPITATNGLINTETTNASTFSAGVRAFLGAEYFILPKIAIGGEFGWGVGISSTGESVAIVEAWDAATSTIKTTEIITRTSSSSFNANNDNKNGIFGPAGKISVTLHF